MSCVMHVIHLVYQLSHLVIMTRLLTTLVTLTCALAYINTCHAVQTFTVRNTSSSSSSTYTELKQHIISQKQQHSPAQHDTRA